MNDNPTPADAPPASGGISAMNVRAILAFLAALAVALGLFATIGAGSAGTISFVFLIILPAALSAFVAWVGGRGRGWRRGHYVAVPLVLTLAAVIVGALVLHEGVICIAMLAPIWAISGLLGVWPVYRAQRNEQHINPEIFRANALLILPFLALWVEQQIPPPASIETVRSSIIIDAPAARLWPQLASIRDVRGDEGRFNFTQSVLGVPRPVDAHLSGEGIGAVRHALWAGPVRFEEHITHWQAGRAMAWRFAFPDPSIATRTDPHIAPDGPHLQIESGGYRLDPLSGGRTRLTLWTRYRLRTPVNWYGHLWGQRLLGDIQGNILAIIKARTDGVPPAI